MKPPVLVIDIGNTSTTTALVNGDQVQRIHRFLRKNGAAENVRQAALLYGDTPLRGMALGSVVPDLSPVWRDGLSAALQIPAWELIPGRPLEIPVTYPQPERIGADRLANAVAAVHKVGMPVVVADFGTALTFDIVLTGKGYVGGVIAPGIEMMYSYFGEKTALLPRLEPQVARTVIGTSTAAAMHAGAHFGYRGMVREIFREIVRETGDPSLKLLATGGFAAQVMEGFEEPVTLMPTLTLEGLALARAFDLKEEV